MSKFEVNIFKPVYSQINELTKFGLLGKIAYFTPKGGILGIYSALDVKAMTHYERAPIVPLFADPSFLTSTTATLFPDAEGKYFCEIPLPILKKICTKAKWQELKELTTSSQFTPKKALELIQRPEVDFGTKAVAIHSINLQAFYQSSDNLGIPEISIIVFEKPINYAGTSFHFVISHIAHGLFPINFPFIACAELSDLIINSSDNYLLFSGQRFPEIIESFIEGNSEETLANELFRHGTA